MALITPTKTNAQGFTPKEQADLDAAEQELDAGEPVEEAEAVAEPEAPVEDAEPEAIEEAPQDAPKDAPKGKPPAGYVPIAALKERDHKLQEMREKVARMEGAWTQIQQRFQQPQQPAQPNGQAPQAPAQIPEYDKDPLGHLQGTIQMLHAELASIKGHTQQQTQLTQQQQQYQQVMNRYANDLSAQSRKTPDFTDAYNWLAANVEAELEARGFEDPQQRQMIMRQEEETIIANAYQAGKNPAEILYNLAKHRGFKAKPPVVEENKLERLQKGQKAAASLSATKGAAANAGSAANMSLEALSELYKSDPDAADRMWVQMARAGRL